MLGACFGVPDAIAQASPDAVVEQVRSNFRQLEFERVEVLAEDALEDHGRFSPGQLEELHTLLGLTYFYREREEEAHRQFAAALTLNPDLELDPLLVPPRAMAFFEQAKQTFLAERPEDVTAAELRYVLLHDPRPAAAMRSFLAPGWGQMYKAERAKGAILLGLWGLTAGGSLLAHMTRANAVREYEDAGHVFPAEPEEIAALGDKMDRWHKIRNNLLLGAAVVWAYSAVDAVVTGGPTLQLTSGRPGLTFRARF